MKRVELALLMVMCLSAAAVPAAGDGPEFARRPTVARDGKGVRITFAVDQPTDVAVSILDAEGAIIRHLAAGVLGENAPAPLQKKSLSQSLMWDGRDDAGNPVGADVSGFKVKIGRGLKPEFDRILGYDPNTLGVMRGLAVGPDGELFVLNLGHHLHLGFGSTVCNVFDRNGVYRRTIMPYRAGCFPERVKEFGILDLGENGRHPWIHANHLKTLYPFTEQPAHQRPAVTPDGRFVLVMKVRGKGAVLVAVDARDGGIPESGAFGPALGVKDMTGFACLAAAPDEETLYVSGVASQKEWKPVRWKHAVYRAKWGEKVVTPFIGKPEEAGTGAAGLNSPQGVAVDRLGNIYVADRGNNRVAVFSPQGEFLNDLPVEDPYMLGVHRKSGAIYVLAKGDPPGHIVKFSSRKDPAPVYSREIPRMMRALRGKKRLDSYPVFALDASAKEPVLWVGSSSAWEAFQIYRFVETGGKLSAPVEQGRGHGFRACREIQVDRKREEVYFHQGAGVADRGGRFVKINGVDGKILKSLRGPTIGSHFALGHDGYVYVVNGIVKRIYRYDRDLKPAPFPGRDTNISDPIPGHRYSNHIMGRGLAVRHDGSMYILHENLSQVHQRYGISVWGPDGRLRKENLVGSLSQGAVSLRIDPAGNLYVGDPVKPAGQVVPPAFRGKVDTAKKRSYQVDNHYAIMYGSILKFSPGGGAGVGPKVEGRKGLLAYDAPVGIKGDLWQYFGVGPIPAYKGGTYKHYAFSGCSCEGMRFDVDGYGRTFAPDAARFRVVVLDTNGNEICFFGRYGNQDSPSAVTPGPTGTGRARQAPTRDVPLTWPAAVGVSDRAAYIGDLLSRRIVRVKLNYAAEATCGID